MYLAISEYQVDVYCLTINLYEQIGLWRTVFPIAIGTNYHEFSGFRNNTDLFLTVFCMSEV